MSTQNPRQGWENTTGISALLMQQSKFCVIHGLSAALGSLRSVACIIFKLSRMWHIISNSFYFSASSKVTAVLLQDTFNRANKLVQELQRQGKNRDLKSSLLILIPYSIRCSNVMPKNLYTFIAFMHALPML